MVRWCQNLLYSGGDELVAYIDKIETVDDLKRNSENVLRELKSVIDSLDFKKAKTLLYWLDTWGRKYLRQEDTFDYNSLIPYRRGAIIKVDLGFKVGSEQGGLHYAVVVENNNSPSNRTVMAIPLRSLKEDESPEDIDLKHEVFLGFDVFSKEIKLVQQKLKKMEHQKMKILNEGGDASRIKNKIKDLRKTINNYSKGSVALVNQMCAVSKMRIYCPKYPNDELYSTFLTPEKLNEIDQKIKELFTKPESKKGVDKMVNML